MTQEKDYQKEIEVFKNMGWDEKTIKEAIEGLKKVEMERKQEEESLLSVKDATIYLQDKLQKQMWNENKVRRYIRNGFIKPHNQIDRKAETGSPIKEGYRIHVQELERFVKEEKMSKEDWKKLAEHLQKEVNRLKALLNKEEEPQKVADEVPKGQIDLYEALEQEEKEDVQEAEMVEVKETEVVTEEPKKSVTKNSWKIKNPPDINSLTFINGELEGVQLVEFKEVRKPFEAEFENNEAMTITRLFKDKQGKPIKSESADKENFNLLKPYLEAVFKEEKERREEQRRHEQQLRLLEEQRTINYEHDCRNKDKEHKGEFGSHYTESVTRHEDSLYFHGKDNRFNFGIRLAANDIMLEWCYDDLKAYLVTEEGKKLLLEGKNSECDKFKAELNEMYKRGDI